MTSNFTVGVECPLNKTPPRNHRSYSLVEEMRGPESRALGPIGIVGRISAGQGTQALLVSRIALAADVSLSPPDPVGVFLLRFVGLSARARQE
jgi:hypothetical protein